MQKISVIGLGKLGMPLLATIASRGFEVIGVDVKKAIVKEISKGQSSVVEPKVGQLIRKYRNRIKASNNYQEAINKTDITFIIVPTPSTEDGSFSNKFVLDAAGLIGKTLKNKDKYHLVAVTSTVTPFSMEGEILPLLERSSGKRVSVDFGLAYNPEFIALGTVVDNLLTPDFVLIGESDKKAGEILARFYKKFCTNKPPIARMNFINAELTKIALNSYITTKISFANTLAQICEKVPGGDVDLVTSAIGLDRRVGAKYLKGALPYGGPCFPRDNRAFLHSAQKIKVNAPIAAATDTVNKVMTDQFASTLYRKANALRAKVAILGLAYKPDTDVAEESAGVAIANYLAQKGVKVYAWDSKANKNAKVYFSRKVRIASSLANCIKGAKIIVVTTPDAGFKELVIPKSSQKPILVDCWRILDPLKYQKVAQYKTIGVSVYSL